MASEERGRVDVDVADGGAKWSEGRATMYRWVVRTAEVVVCSRSAIRDVACEEGSRSEVVEVLEKGENGRSERVEVEPPVVSLAEASGVEWEE